MKISVCALVVILGLLIDLDSPASAQFVSSWSLLIRGDHRRIQADFPLIILSRFHRPALTFYERPDAISEDQICLYAKPRSDQLIWPLSRGAK